MANKLTVTLHIGGKQVETLTEDEREKMTQSISKAMSIYYTAHPEEFTKIGKKK